MPKYDFNKFGLQFYWSHTSALVFSCKFPILLDRIHRFLDFIRIHINKSFSTWNTKSFVWFWAKKFISKKHSCSEGTKFIYKLYNTKYSGLYRTQSKIYDGGFLRNNGRFLQFTIFAEKVPSLMFDWVLNTSLKESR